jgi:Ni,Fe-hydrogenase III component G
MSTLAAVQVTTEDLLHQVALCRTHGYRLITITCLDTGSSHELLYHFDKHYQMMHLRLELPYNKPLESITGLFPSAMIVENEIKDHFGLQISGLSIDFKGRLVLTEQAPQAPMSKRCGIGIDARVPGAAKTTTADNGGTH